MRTRVLQLACAVAGIAVAGVLARTMVVSVTRKTPPIPATVSFKVARSVPIATVPTDKILPVEAAKPVPKKPKKKPALATEPLVAPAVPDNEQSPTIIESTEMLPAQPAPQAAVRPAPPAPPDDPAPASPFTEKPGGDTLVMLVLLNDAGVVQDARIAVPSFNELGDLTFVLSAKGVKWDSISPPLAKGEMRWVPVRITYANPHSADLP